MSPALYAQTQSSDGSPSKKGKPFVEVIDYPDSLAYMHLTNWGYTAFEFQITPTRVLGIFKVTDQRISFHPIREPIAPYMTQRMLARTYNVNFLVKDVDIHYSEIQQVGRGRKLRLVTRDGRKIVISSFKHGSTKALKKSIKDYLANNPVAK